ncbi:MAG: CoA transferase, partial [Myxococcota bacterium]
MLAGIIFDTVRTVPDADAATPAPLSGVRVLDFTMNLPGPYATLVLASLGAEVIKVEPPRGDTARHIGRLFDIVNRGKKSVAVDLKSQAGRDALAPLVASADVIIEGFRPGVMASFGLDAETLRARDPKLVYCSVSGFGQSGPYRDYPAHDLNLQAITGVCHMMRDTDDHPWGCALPIADFSSGLTAVTAVVAALFARERQGVGASLDVALTDTVLSWAYVWSEGLNAEDARLSAAVGPVGKWLRRRDAAASGNAVVQRLQALVDDDKTPGRLDRLGDAMKRTRRFDQFARLRLHALPHYGVFQTGDGRWLSIGIVDEDKFWRALCQALGLPTPLAALPGAARLVAGGPLRRLIARALRRRPLAHWVQHFDRASVPVAAVLPLTEALRDPQLLTRIAGPLGAAVPTPLVPPNARSVSTLGLGVRSRISCIRQEMRCYRRPGERLSGRRYRNAWLELRARFLGCEQLMCP